MFSALGISDGNAITTLKVQCKGCDEHIHPEIAEPVRFEQILTLVGLAVVAVLALVFDLDIGFVSISVAVGTASAFSSVYEPISTPADGFAHTLLLRRSITDPDDVTYFLAHAPDPTPAPSSAEPEPETRVRLVMSDGTTATRGLDPESV